MFELTAFTFISIENLLMIHGFKTTKRRSSRRIEKFFF